eukprot:263569-Chlamydomonas_euryale.AAC.1
MIELQDEGRHAPCFDDLESRRLCSVRLGNICLAQLLPSMKMEDRSRCTTSARQGSVYVHNKLPEVSANQSGCWSLTNHRGGEGHSWPDPWGAEGSCHGCTCDAFPAELHKLQLKLQAAVNPAGLGRRSILRGMPAAQRRRQHGRSGRRRGPSTTAAAGQPHSWSKGPGVGPADFGFQFSSADAKQRQLEAFASATVSLGRMMSALIAAAHAQAERHASPAACTSRAIGASRGDLLRGFEGGRDLEAARPRPRRE